MRNISTTDDKTIRLLFDFIKAFAIVWIFSYHFYNFRQMMSPFGPDYAKSVIELYFVNANGGLADYLKGTFTMLFLNGHHGVELFFIASGFGIHLSQIRTQRGWVEFYMRRFIRVVPLYWMALLIISLIQNIEPAVLLKHAFFIGIYSTRPLAFGPLWFVSTLALFYLLIPIITPIFKNPLGGWCAFALSLALIPAAGWAGIEIGGMNILTYMPCFLLGMNLASMHHRGGAYKWRLVLSLSIGMACALAFIASVVISSYHAASPYILSKALLGILAFVALAGMFIVALSLPGISWATKRLPGIIAYASYLAFLSHMTIIYILGTVMVKTGPMHFMVIQKGGVYFTSDGEYVIFGVVTFVMVTAFSYMAQMGYDMALVRVTKRLGTKTAPDPI